VFAPDGARAAIREMFLAHVIGGKKLSRDPDFTRLVRAATPDVVLRGVTVLAGQHGDVAAVDVGGATTDVHSVVELDPEDAIPHASRGSVGRPPETLLGPSRESGRRPRETSLSREVVAVHPVTRTVEGDLGMRWNALPVVDAGVEAGLIQDSPELRAAARRRNEEPAFLPGDAGETAYDELLATVAVTVALRRHAGRQRVVFGPDGRVVERSGTDLREVDLLVGSGGVLRHNGPETARRVLGAVARGADREGWLVPAAARACVDQDYVLAGAGLLAEIDPAAANGLVSRIGAVALP
jgi:hypothetical protein